MYVNWDQDDYVEPKQPNDYVPFIHVGSKVEYIDKQVAYPPDEERNLSLKKLTKIINQGKNRHRGKQY